MNSKIYEKNKMDCRSGNKLSSLAMECDSCAAIEETRMTDSERQTLQKMLSKAVDWIDSKI